MTERLQWGSLTATPPRRIHPRLGGLAALLGALAALALAGCGAATAGADPGRGILAIGAESQYANVIAQIGGRYVTAVAVERNPNIDPHAFEASPSIAREVARARVVVLNGAGYDSFMNQIVSASASRSRRVIVVQKLLGLPDSIPNPHLWYMERTMPALAQALVAELSALAPSHRDYFAANARRFDASLQPWYRALARFARRYPHTQVATTEPVGDYMLQAAGTVDLTPSGLQADVMNGIDPAPQDIAAQSGLLARHRVKALLYNRQVTDTMTAAFLAQAQDHGIPTVALYETMPSGFDYQSWMLAEVDALGRAVAHGTSTLRLR